MGNTCVCLESINSEVITRQLDIWIEEAGKSEYFHRPAGQYAKGNIEGNRTEWPPDGKGDVISGKEDGNANKDNDKDTTLSSNFHYSESTKSSDEQIPSISQTTPTSNRSDAEDREESLNYQSCTNSFTPSKPFQKSVLYASNTNKSTEVNGMNNQVPQERPTVTLEGGLIYTGQWLHDVKEGFGVLIRQDGSKYEGNFKNDKANGFGKFIHIRGDIYEGNWVDDAAHGYGEFRHADGSSYKGQWSNDIQHGYGEEIWPDGSSFKGQYSQSKKEGSGVFYWADGAVYIGQFKRNKLHGCGIYIWPDGRKYSGYWKENKMHGRSIMEWADGRRYEGYFDNDIKHGFGTFMWPTGNYYSGYWENDRLHGKGILGYYERLDKSNDSSREKTVAELMDSIETEVNDSFRTSSANYKFVPACMGMWNNGFDLIKSEPRNNSSNASLSNDKEVSVLGDLCETRVASKVNNGKINKQHFKGNTLHFQVLSRLVTWKCRKN